MNVTNKLRKDAGFAAIEGVLILVILAAVVGTGVYVLKQKNSANKSLSSNTTTQNVDAAQTAASPTASLDKLTQQESISEAGFDTAGDSQTEQATTTVTSADSNVGGSVDESTL